MSGDPGPMVRRRQLGALLQRYRSAAGLSVKEAAEQIFEPSSKITRIEKAQRPASVRDIVDLCRLYGLPDETKDQLIELARGTRERQWWQRSGISPALQSLIGMEGAATSISEFALAAVPGLLQTEAYADAMVQEWLPDTQKRRDAVAVRLRRQTILGLPEPPAVHILLDEGVVRHVVGGPHVMREQLRHIEELASVGPIDLRVVPFSAGAHRGMNNSFTVLEFGGLTALADANPLPGVVFLESADSDRYLDTSDDAAFHLSCFQRLQAKALSTEESINLVRTAAENL
ncbi:helix-turn-helix transcriptional regulator [Actinoplanes sp. NPDC051851]|uniref:helix-turn-helix domain-containing protein n=1 Tax=Actinoplanes sp. NPDC051851 TaxID=3154753 RepID=UPI00341E40F8